MPQHGIIASAIAMTGLFAIAACSKKDAALQDSVGSTNVSQAVDTGVRSMGGMDHSTMTAMPAKDADQEFVRMMVDHHQGMIAMSDTALAKNPSQGVRAEATRMKMQQAAEQKKMVDMLKSDYAEDKMPMVMASNAQMIAQIASKSGAALDKTFREQVIAHHEEALKMISDYETKLTKPAVRTMASKMKLDQQKEITELKSKLSSM